MHRALPAAVLLLALALPAAAGELPRGVAGITLGLSVNQAHARLARIGVRARETEASEHEAGPGAEQEMWTLRDPRYAYLQVLVGPDGRVRMVEAWVRKGGPGLLFRDIVFVRTIHARRGQHVEIQVIAERETGGPETFARARRQQGPQIT